VKRSNVLDWEEVPSPLTNNDKNNAKEIKFCRLTLRPNTQFVYGGDTVDKGPGDIRLVRALVSLKQRYPDRVQLLVGNRDLNKIRLTSELSDDDMNRRISDIPKPFWNRNAKSLQEHLEEILLQESNDGGSINSAEDLNTRPERLRYLLKHTLGCPDTFEFRRDEIQLLTRIYGEYPTTLLETHDYIPLGDLGDLNVDTACKITDDEVVNSFLYEMSEEGSLYQYLTLSQIAALIGNTIFVHGSIDELTMKFVPPLDIKFELPKSPPPVDSSDGKMIEDVHQWVHELNDFLQHGMKDFVERPQWNEDRTSRGGEALLAIQNRPSMWGRSVVCNSYADGGVIYTADAEKERIESLRVAKVDPLAFEGIASNVFDPIPAQWLLKYGIKRVVVGHKPTGDCPAVLSSKYTGVEIVSLDTSYSHRKDLQESKKRFGENRGDAIGLIEIIGDDALNNWLESSGALACGTEYLNQLPILSSCETNNNEDKSRHSGDPYLGSKLRSGWWVKAAVPPNYHLCRGSGRFVEYCTCPIEAITNELE